MFANIWGKAEEFIRRARPEFILFQCGADSLAGDPLAHLDYSAASHRMVAGALRRIAQENCQSRLLAWEGADIYPKTWLRRGAVSLRSYWLVVKVTGLPEG